MFKQNTLHVAITVLLLAAFFFPAITSAASKGAILEEIIVTATKRETALQDVPSAVTVFSEDTMKYENITRPEDFIAMTPNATIREGSFEGETFVTIRGDAQTRNTESPVAVVVDGVLRTGRTQLNQELFDVAQIEVLKGPQGFLYGRNAIAGAIVITTKMPRNEWAGKASIGFGKKNYITGRFTAGGAIVEDKLLVQLGGSYSDRDGYFRNITTGEDMDPQNQKSGRLKLVWQPSDNFFANFSAASSRYEGGSVLPSFLTAIPGFQSTPQNAYLDINRVHEVPYVRNPVEYAVSEQENYALRLEYELSSGTVSSSTTYDKVDDVFPADNVPFTPVLDTVQFNAVSTEAFSQEIRFTSRDDKDFRYIFGAYYLKKDNTPNVHAVLGLDPGGFVLNTWDPIPAGEPQETISFISDNLYTDAWAVFVNFEYDITDSLELIVAGRYDEEDKKTVDVAPPEWSATSGQIRKRKYNEFQPKLNLTWRASDDLSFYAGYARGFQAGGFNGAQTSARTGGTVTNEFGQSTADNYEIGMKSKWLDGKMILNAAVFNNKKKGAQQFIFVPEGTLNAVIPIEKVDIKGADLEIQAAPTDNLLLSAGIGWIDAEVKKYNHDPSLVGNNAPWAPDLTGNLALTHFMGLDKLGFPNVQMITNVEYQHRGSQYPSVNNVDLWKIDAMNLINAKITFESENGFSLSFWGKNLTDEEYVGDAVPVFADPALLTIAAQRSQPLSWGVEFSYEF
jgi:iron complex outermembrane receptor protein